MDDPQAPRLVQLEFEKIVEEALEASAAHRPSKKRRRGGGRKKGTAKKGAGDSGTKDGQTAAFAIAADGWLKSPDSREFDRGWLEASLARIHEAPDLRSALVSAVSSLAALVDSDMESQNAFSLDRGDYTEYCVCMDLLATHFYGTEHFCAWAWSHAVRMFEAYSACRFESDWQILEQLRDDEGRSFEIQLPERTVQTEDAWGGLEAALHGTYMWLTVGPPDETEDRSSSNSGGA